MNKLVCAISQGRIVADESKINVLYLIIGRHTFRFCNGRYAGQVLEKAEKGGD